MAVKVWRGTAAGIQQVDTATVSGTWTAGDEAYLEINGSRLVVTIGAATTVADVAEAVTAAINATSKTDSVVGTETRNFGGQELPELSEVTASNTATEVVLEGNTAGVPFTATWPAPSTASSGTISGAATTAATGPNHFDNEDNWSTGAVPVTGDEIVFQDSAVDCLYGLEQFSVTNCTLQFDSSFTGRLGLSPKNPNNYDEYRTRHLQVIPTTAARGLVVGGGPGNGSPRLNIDPSTTAIQAVINFTSTAESGAKAAVDLINMAGATIAVRQGSVSLAAMASNEASVATLEMTYNTQVATDALVYVGTKGRVDNINKTGGELRFVNTDGGTVASCVSRAGIVEFHGKMGVTFLDVQGGRMYWKSTGTLESPKVGGAGVLDFSQDADLKTVTNPIERYSNNSRILDPNKVVTNLRIDNNEVSDTTNLELGTDFRITRGATA